MEFGYEFYLPFGATQSELILSLLVEKWLFLFHSWIFFVHER